MQKTTPLKLTLDQLKTLSEEQKKEFLLRLFKDVPETRERMMK